MDRALAVPMVTARVSRRETYAQIVTALTALDEASASLDAAADAALQKMLREVFGESTVLAIAHRLQTIVDYDTVLVLDHGVVLEHGPPQQLLSAGGAFAAMVHEAAD